MGEIRRCSLCEKAEGRIVTVKESTKRARLMVCDSCWKKYYADEIKNEKITLLDRVGIVIKREKDIAKSMRKLRNIVMVMITLILVYALGRALFSMIFANKLLSGQFVLGLDELDKFLSVFGVVAAIWIVAYALSVLFRIVARILFRDKD